MMPAAVRRPDTPGDGSTTTSRVSQVLSWILLVLLWALLIEVLFEAWTQIQLADVHVNAEGEAVPALPEWPKNLKNGLYLAIAALTVTKVALERRWREFTTAADLAIVVLAGMLVLVGLVGGSPIPLIGEAVFVYLRGALAFYAWRALDAPWRRVRPLLYVLGGVVVLNAVIALIQMAVGAQAFSWFGWVDMTWANIFRVQGLFDHPNHLGHVTALALLGLLSWFVTRPAGTPVGRRWWLLFGLLALSLSATQSRESAIGFLAGALLIWLLRRGHGRTVVAAVLVVGLFVAVQIALRPKNREELQRRLVGVFQAFMMGSGEEPAGFCVKGNEGCTEDRPQIEQREIRILFMQQGVKLWAKEPVFGYGVGQFGGIVAFRHDPQWYQDPRFGPGGFNLYGFTDKQVDSFWLHLLVETGLAGSIAYLVWLAFLAWPLLSGAGRSGLPGWPLLRRIRGPTPPGTEGSPFAYWALSSLLLAVLIAFLSGSLEDPLFPPLLFTILGLAWVDRRRPLLGRRTAETVPAPATAGEES